MQNVTVLVRRWQDDGDNESRELVFGLLHQHLIQAARQRLSKYGCITLQPGDVANEAIARMLGSDATYEDRAHLMGVAALRMRGVVVDHLRARFSVKRGNAPIRVDITMSGLKAGDDNQPFEIMALSQTLDKLAEFDTRCAQVIEMTYFGGMDRKEVAAALDISVPSVDRDLVFGRSFLSRELTR